MAEVFKFNKYDSSKEASVFTTENDYNETTGEEDTRKQFSFPLSEIKEHLNNFTSLNADDEAVQLRLNEQNILQYRDNEVWRDTASSGHQVMVEDEEGFFPPFTFSRNVMTPCEFPNYPRSLAMLPRVSATSHISVSP